MIRLHVLYFGIVRERLGRREEALEVADGTRVGDLLAQIEQRHQQFGVAVASVRVAVNSEYVDSGRVLSDNDEVAIIPPVSGG